jgi:hypothetical protein
MADRLTLVGRERIEAERDSAAFRAAAWALREMIELGDHPGITLATASVLCRMLDEAAREVSEVETEPRHGLRRVAHTIQDRRSWSGRHSGDRPCGDAAR